MGIVDLINKDVTQQELLNYYNACVSYESLPSKIDGYVFQYKGIYNIFVNKNLSYYKKKKTILHELAHIELNHLGQIDHELFAFKVQFCEDDADTYLGMLLNLKRKADNQNTRLYSFSFEDNINMESNL